METHLNVSAGSGRRPLCRSQFVVGSILGAVLTTGAGAAGATRRLAAFAGATAWLNSPALTPAGLRGKVVLVDFWTYSCINWRRTLPYVRAWDEAYRDRGLVVVGVHTPEFGFERDLAAVRREAAVMRVRYPIAIDNSYSIWNAFGNRYWPALYVIDARGDIRHREFGEGNEERAEAAIRTLLAEAGHGGFADRPRAVTATGVEVAADWANLKTPETYVGYDRAERFASLGGVVRDKPRGYVAPARLERNDWALAGAWTVRNQSAVSTAAGGRIVYRFHARDLHLVMGAAKRGSRVPFRMFIDGLAPGTARGVDVDAHGYGVLAEPRLYQLIRQPKPIRDRSFEIEFMNEGAEAFSFTFG